MKIPRYLAQPVNIPPALSDPASAGTPYYAQIRAEEAQQRAGLQFQAAGKEISDAIGTYNKHEAYREEKRREAAQAIERIDQVSSITSGIADMAQQYALDTDHATKAERWSGQARKYVDDQLATIKDPLVQRVVKVDVEKQLLHYGLDVKKIAVGQRLNEFQATLNKSLDEISVQEAQAPDPVSQAKLRDTRQSMLAQAQQAGVITAVQAQKIDSDMDDKIVEAAVRKDIDADPKMALERIKQGEYPIKDAQRRQVIHDWAKREIESRETKALRDEQKSLVRAEKEDKEQKKQAEKAQNKNFFTLAAGQLDPDPRKRPTIQDFKEAADGGFIREEHFLKLTQRDHKDLTAELDRAKTDVEKMIRTTGMMSITVDNEETAKIVRYKRELDERVRNNGEDPQQVLAEFELREDQIPKTPKSYPAPLFLTGDRHEVKNLEAAAQATADALAAGRITEKQAHNNLKLIRDLKVSVEAYGKKPTEPSATDKPKTGKGANFVPVQ